MTRPNKAVAVSSLKGKTLWSRLIREPVRRMVVDQAGGDATLEVVTSKGNLIKIDPLTGAVRTTEALSLPQSVDDTEFVIAQGHTQGDQSEHRTAILAVPKNGEGAIVNVNQDV